MAESMAFADVLKLLKETKELVTEWEEKRKKVLAQLESIKNMDTQLDSLQKCETEGTLGVLCNLTNVRLRLRGKLFASQERALAFIERDQKLMDKTVKDLLNKSKEAQKIWIKIVERKGLELPLERKPESFSITDWVYWIKEVSCLVYASWKTMTPIKAPLTAAMHSTWNEEMVGVKEIIEFINYTMTERTQ